MSFEMELYRPQTIRRWRVCPQFLLEKKWTANSFPCCFDPALLEMSLLEKEAKHAEVAR